jgi:tol-pal system protein YbgF
LKKNLVLCFIVVLAFLCGCATSGDLKKVQQNQDQRTVELREQVNRMSNDLASAQKDLAEVMETNKTLRKGQADAGADMINLRDNVQNLRGSVDEMKKEFSALNQQKGGGLKEMKDKLDDLSFRVEYIESFIGVSKKEAPSAAREEGKPSTAAGAAEARSDRETAYQAAYNSFKEGKYAQSREEFSKFLKQYPKGEYADNAQFWLGECYYLEGNYEKAILEYEKVIKNFPKGGKNPDAMLKQGLAFQKLGDKQSAKLIFQQVTKKYPSSNQAKIAKAKLKEIK